MTPRRSAGPGSPMVGSQCDQSFEVCNPSTSAGHAASVSSEAAAAAFAAAGIAPSDVGLLQLQDNESEAEIRSWTWCNSCEDGVRTHKVPASRRVIRSPGRERMCGAVARRPPRCR